MAFVFAGVCWMLETTIILRTCGCQSSRCIFPVDEARNSTVQGSPCLLWPHHEFHMLLVNGHDYWPGITISKLANVTIQPSTVYSALEPRVLLTPDLKLSSCTYVLSLH